MGKREVAGILDGREASSPLVEQVGDDAGSQFEDVTAEVQLIKRGKANRTAYSIFLESR